LFGLCIPLLACLIGAARADSVLARPIEEVKDSEQVFGDTRVLFTVDREMDRFHYDSLLQVYYRGRLQFQLRNVGWLQMFASPGNDTFVGLSNSGLTAAVIVFDRRGFILLLVRHGMAEFQYCSKSVTIDRTWYDPENPGVRFVQDRSAIRLSGIRVRTCRGEEVDLFEEVLRAQERAYRQVMGK